MPSEVRPVPAQQRLGEISFKAYDRLIGLELSDMAADGCITNAPCGSEKVGVDRRKRGVRRSTAVDAGSVPLGTVVASANRHDSSLLAGTLQAVAEALGRLPEKTSVHVDRGYDSGAPRGRPRESGLLAEIPEKGKPALMSVTRR